MRFCLALLIYSIFFQWSRAQVTIWYEQMSGYPSSQSSNVWIRTGDVLMLGKSSDFSDRFCPGGNCWLYHSSAAGSYQLSVSTAQYTSVQFTYSIEGNEISGSESCYIDYSVDGTTFSSIVSVDRQIADANGFYSVQYQTYDAWTDAAGVSSLTIKFGSSKVGAYCGFNQFRLSGKPLTSNPSTEPTNDPSASPTTHEPSLSPSIPTQNPSKAPSTSNPSPSPTRHPTPTPTAVTLHPTSNPSPSPTKHPTSSPSSTPTSSPSSSPTKQPTAAPTSVTIHPTLQPSAPPTLRPSAVPTMPPTCGGNQRCSEKAIVPIHDSYETAWIAKEGYGFNAANIDYVFTFTVSGDVPCIRPRLRVLWQRIPNYITVYVNGVRAGSCSSSSSRCGSYYYCIGSYYTGYYIDSSQTPYYAGKQWIVRLDHSANNACLQSGSYVHLDVEVQLRCYGWTPAPTASPSSPTASPTAAPTITSLDPTNAPSFAPTSPSVPPTNAPSSSPSQPPTIAPSSSPTRSPSNAPTISSESPTRAPSQAPTFAPSDTSQSPTATTATPTTGAPSQRPTPQPTVRWYCASNTFCYNYEIAPVAGIPISQTVSVQHSGETRYDPTYDVLFEITGSEPCYNASFDFVYEQSAQYSGGNLRVYDDAGVLVTTIGGGTVACGEMQQGVFDYSLGEQFAVGEVITLRLYKTWCWGWCGGGRPCSNSLNSAFTLYCGNRTPDPTANPTTAAPTSVSDAPSMPPTIPPTQQTNAPTLPSNHPTTAPTSPTATPTAAPTIITTAPIPAPTADTMAPTRPTTTPTQSTSAPSKPPTRNPTNAPTVASGAPTTAIPTKMPTVVPTSDPSKQPTLNPSKAPTRPPTNAPTTVSPTAVSDAPTRSTNAPTTGAPTATPTESPTTELCANANAFCYTADVHSASTNESTSFSVDIQNTDGGDVEIYDVYFTARNGACYAPSIALNYTAMYDANLLTILDANDKVMAHCQTKKKCGSYSECVRDYNLGIRTLYEHQTYVLRVFGRYLSNGCNGTDTVDLKIDFVCDAIPPPSVAPTGHPIAPTTKTPTGTITTTATAIATDLLNDDDSSGSQDGEFSVSDTIEANLAIVIVAGGALIALIALCCCIKRKKTNDKQRLEQTIQSEDDANMNDIQDNVLMELQTVRQSENETQAMVGATDAAPAVVASNDEN